MSWKDILKAWSGDEEDDSDWVHPTKRKYD